MPIVYSNNISGKTPVHLLLTMSQCIYHTLRCRHQVQTSLILSSCPWVTDREESRNNDIDVPAHHKQPQLIPLSQTAIVTPFEGWSFSRISHKITLPVTGLSIHMSCLYTCPVYTHVLLVVFDRIGHSPNAKTLTLWLMKTCTCIPSMQQSSCNAAIMSWHTCIIIGGDKYQ